MERIATPHRNRADSREPEWYCVRSQPKHEHIAAAHLRMLEHVTGFLPPDQIQTDDPAGPGLGHRGNVPRIFVCPFRAGGNASAGSVCSWRERYRPVRRSLPHDRRPRLWRSCGNIQVAAEITELNYELSQGDQVKIVEGVFVGLEAVVTQVVPAKERVKILMDFLGRKVEADVEHTSVLLDVAHPLAV